MIFSLEDKIQTNYTGYNQLSPFYHSCLGHPTPSNFHLDFKDVEWFDGNLSALLLAMVYHLNKTYGHTVSTDAAKIKERFDVLFRNGFMNGGIPVYDDRESTIPIEVGFHKMMLLLQN